MKIITLNGLRNTRDIGGYVNNEGKRIISNKFIRSCELSKVNKKDKDKFINNYNIQTIIDFRTDVELKKKPIPKLLHTKIFHLPILEDVNLGIPRNIKQLFTMYKNIISKNISPDTFLTNMYLNMAFSDYSTQMYRKFFNILLSNPQGSILFNCTEGKDRTGLATMLLMMVLNFDRNTIIKDYMISKKFCDIKMKLYEKRCKRFFIGKRITKFVTGIMATKEMFLNAVFDKIERDFHSIDNYLKQKLLLTNDDILKLRSMYLTEN